MAVDLGDFATLPDAESAAPGLGDFGSLPDTKGESSPELGDFGSLPDLNPTTAPKTGAAVAETKGLVDRAFDLAKTPSPQFLQPFEAGVKHNVQQVKEHPLQTLLSLVDIRDIPQLPGNLRKDFQNWKAATKGEPLPNPEAAKPIGTKEYSDWIHSQEFWDELSAYTLMTLGGEAVGPAVAPLFRRKAAEAPKPSVEAPKAETATSTPQGVETKVQPATEVARVVETEPLVQETLINKGEVLGEKVEPRGLQPEEAKGIPTELKEATPETPPVEPQRVTSIKNEQVDAERAQRGQPPLMSEAARDFGPPWEEAMQKIASDPGYQDRLIGELIDKPRPHTDTEVAALTHRKVELNNELAKAADDLVEAKSSGDLEALRVADVRANEAMTKLNMLDEATTRSGTESSRGLNARKMALAEDFSLSRMVTLEQIAKGGEPLTAEELVTIKRQSQTINDLLNKRDTQLKAAKTRAGKQATELRIGTAIGDFSKRKATKTVPDSELANIQADLELAIRDWKSGLEKHRWKRMTVFQKTKSTAGKTYDAARLLLTTGEFSFILRQGKWNAASHPIRTAKAIPDAIRAMRNEKTALRIENEDIFSQPDYKFAKQDKVAITESDAPLSRQEELTMGAWGEKIPVVAAFNRAARVFLNKIRFDTYRALRNSLPPELRTPEATRQFAMYVNESTGRGGLGKYGEPAAVGLARVLFSPRYLASRFQLAAGHSMWGGTKASRVAIAREYARSLIGMGIYYSLLKTYFGRDGKQAEINTDSNSSNFGKVVLGNTTLDPLAGLSQIATFESRTITGKTTRLSGEEVPIRGEDIPYGGDDWWDVAGRFGRTKLHPVPGSIANLLTGRDLVGNASTFGTESTKLFAPITYLDVYHAMKEQDVDDATALALLAFLGEGLQTRQPRPGGSSSTLRKPTRAVTR